MYKRFLSALMAFVMVCSLILPVTAFAADTETAATTDIADEPATDEIGDEIVEIIPAETIVPEASTAPAEDAPEETISEEIPETTEATPEAEITAEDPTEETTAEEDETVYAAQIGETKYETLAEAFAAAVDGDTIELLSDVSLSSAVSISTAINVTLTSAEGETHTITRTGRSMRMLYVTKATLTLSNVILDGAYSEIGTNTYSMVEVSSSGTVIMNSGVVMQNANCSFQARGGAVTVSGSGTFIMNGGTVTGCGNSKSSGSTTSAASNPGGAISVYASGSSTLTTTFIMNGGTISNCFGIRGGAVYVGNANANATVQFIMNGGLISNCVAATSQGGSATGYGGAIFVMGKGSTQKYIPTVYINGGEITGCQAYQYGGALGTVTSGSSTVGNHYAGAYVIMGGYIHGNTTSTGNPSSDYGIGIFVAKYRVSSSTVSDDTTLTLGGSARVEGIYLEKSTTMNVVDNFTGYAEIYCGSREEGRVVAYAVTSGGSSTTATGTIAGKLVEVYGFVDDSGSTYPDPSYAIGVNPDDNTQYILGTPITITYTDGVEDEEIFADQVFTVLSGNDTPTIEDPVRAGYTFTGWTPEVAETVTESVTYTATWELTIYTITLDTNGGELPEGTSNTLSVTYGATLTDLPTPTRDGYRFDGWVDAEGNEYTTETVYSLYGDLTLTAQWTLYVARYETTGECFTTLQAAFDAVGNAWKADAPLAAFEESSTITMLADVTENISLSIVPTGGTWSDMNLILDMNGHTLSGTGDTTSTKGVIWLYRATSYNGAYFYFTAKNGTITNGYSTNGAGGVYLTGSHGYLTFDSVRFINNTGSSAGAVTGGVSITATNCTFTGNTGTNGAGAIYSAAGSTLTLSGCIISGNHAGQSGGGIRVNRAASSNKTLDLASGNNIICGNTADVAGDDIFITASSGSKTLTVNLADASVYTGGLDASLYEDGTYDDSTIGEGTRYSEGNETVITDSVQLTYVASSTNLRSIGIKVVLATYTVTYTDGVEDEEVFPDQVYEITVGEATPAFEGTPTRTNYNFIGWEPEVSEIVTGNVTYVAQWEPSTNNKPSNSKKPTATTIKSMQIRAYFIGTDSFSTTKTPLNLSPSNYRANTVSSYEIGEIYGNDVTGYYIDITFHFAHGDTFEGGASTTFNESTSYWKTYAAYMPDWVGNWEYDFDYMEGYGADQVLTLKWSGSAWKSQSIYTGEYTGNLTSNINNLIKAYMTLPRYDVTYTDGVEDAEIFADQVTTGIASGAATPAFTGSTEREGYTFSGWTPEVTETVSATVTYTAVWTANTYTVSFDAGEGVENPDSITVTYDSAIGTLPAPTREGYTFSGWVDSEGNPVTEETIYTTAGDSTLTALWTINQYTIIVTPGNGEVSYEIIATYEDVVAELVATPEREGYTFSGWVDAEGNPVDLDVTYTESFPSELIATWTANEYSITVDPGNGEEPYEIIATYEDVVAELVTTPEREGYTFSGWVDAEGNPVDLDVTYTEDFPAGITATWTANEYSITVDPGNGEEPYEIIATYEDVVADLIATPEKPGYTFSGWVDSEGNPVDLDVTYTEDFSSDLIATWTANENSITVDLGDGSEETTIIIPTDGIIGDYLPEDPTREGYTFDGWVDQDGNPIDPTAPFDPAVITGISATWIANTYTITLVYRDGEGTTSTLTVTYDQAVGTMPIPTREDYTFIGWYTEDGTQITSETIYTYAEDITVYAYWTTPKTGDSFGIYLYMMLMTVSAGAVLYLMGKKKFAR